MPATTTRRSLIRQAIFGGTAVISTGVAGTLTGCATIDTARGSFNHGVASGDPLADRVILWTRVTPSNDQDSNIRVTWEVAKDKEFTELVHRGSALVSRDNDYTLKIDAINLVANKTYYYRFATINATSRVGTTKTLPAGDVTKVKLLALSCANYSAGYFHVYAEAAKQQGVDAALHLGDYIYEHGRGGYASEDAEALGRLAEPAGELLTLADYRARYAQYRSDNHLQDFHAAFPTIPVWDDHEIANNAWRDGAENHDEDTEGAYRERLAAALKAYAEWMPIRPQVEADASSLYRHFQFGDLVNLIMLDTRITGRDQPLALQHFIAADGGFDEVAYAQSVNDPKRTMLGAAQLAWLKTQLKTPSQWSLLGQQVLMGEMVVPGAIATRQISVSQFAALASAARKATSDQAALTEEQRVLLAQKGHLLKLPQLPYNLDAWDGYPAERQAILNYAQAAGANLVVLAGDTHNAWANHLKTSDNKAYAGVEFATPSITSPGIEAFFGLKTAKQIAATEAGVIQLIKNTHYTNLADRGFLAVNFTPDKVTATWTFVSTIKEADYEVQHQRGHTITHAGNRLKR